MSTEKSERQPQRRSPWRKSPLARVLLSLVGAGGLTTIVVALINRGTDEHKKPPTISNKVTATSGATAFTANHSTVNIATHDSKEVDLLKEIRDLLAAGGARQLPPVEAKAQQEAVKTLEAIPEASSFRLGADAPKWLRIAFAEIGEIRADGDGSNPRILEYLAATDLDPLQKATDKTPWSGCFISWVLQQAGYKDVPRSGSIRAFSSWGRDGQPPTPGTLVLLDWGRLNGGNHRYHGGFVLKDLGDKFLIIAGNVRDAVRIQAVPKEAVYAYRMPPQT